mgnify:CR=1 FL=1
MRLYQTQKLLHSKKKIQPSEWENIFADNTSTMQLISNIYKELIQLNNNNNNNNNKQSNFKLGRGLEQTLLPRRHANGQKTYEMMLKFTSY